MIGNEVAFFIDVEPKVLLHVQPNISDFNFHEYVHPTVAPDDVDKMMADFEAKIASASINYNEFMKDIDRIAEEVASIEVGIN